MNHWISLPVIAFFFASGTGVEAQRYSAPPPPPVTPKFNTVARPPQQPLTPQFNRSARPSFSPGGSGWSGKSGAGASPQGRSLTRDFNRHAKPGSNGGYDALKYKVKPPRAQPRDELGRLAPGRTSAPSFSGRAFAGPIPKVVKLSGASQSRIKSSLRETFKKVAGRASMKGIFKRNAGSAAGRADFPTNWKMRVPSLAALKKAKIDKVVAERLRKKIAAAKTVGNPAGKLTYDAATKSWTSPGGLVYGQGSTQGNRVLHVLEHTVPNPAKPVHSVFNVNRNQVIGLVDEAWAARSGPGVLQANGNRVWTVDLGRQVGTGGQTGVQIVVRDGTKEIITAFPK